MPSWASAEPAASTSAIPSSDACFMVSTPVGVRAVFAAVRERPMKRNHAWSSPVAGCAGGVKRAGARWPRSSGFRGAHDGSGFSPRGLRRFLTRTRGNRRLTADDGHGSMSSTSAHVVNASPDTSGSRDGIMTPRFARLLFSLLLPLLLLLPACALPLHAAEASPPRLMLATSTSHDAAPSPAWVIEKTHLSPGRCA